MAKRCCLLEDADTGLKLLSDERAILLHSALRHCEQLAS